MKTGAVLLALLLALFTTGCGSKETKTLDFEELTYTLTGGIAGFDQALVIAADGSYQIAERGKTVKQGKLSAADFQGLKERLTGVSWPAIQERYIDPRVADALFEGATLETEAKTYKTVVGTGGTAPQELTELLALLRRSLTDARR